MTADAKSLSSRIEAGNFGSGFPVPSSPFEGFGYPTPYNARGSNMLTAGMRFGAYEIVSALGSGGMG
jgi:hypothetical protein